MDPTQGRPTPADPGVSDPRRGVRRRAIARAVVVALAIVSIATALAVGSRRDPGALRAEAERLIQGEQYDRADRLLDRIEAAGPPAPEDLILRARVALGRGESERARTLLHRVPDDFPSIGVAWLRTGQIELRRHRFRQAELALLESLRLDPSIDTARRELIYIYGYQLRRSAAREQFLALADPMRLLPSEVLVWCLLHRTSWNPEEAAATLAKAVEADPEDRWSRVALVRNLITLVRLDEAARLLEPLPTSDPEAIALRVELALERQDIEEAEAMLADAPEGHPQLDYVRGRLALARGQYPEAKQALESALKAGPVDEEKVLRNLALALRRLGEDDRADQAGERADALRRLYELVGQALGTDRSGDDATLYKRLGSACLAAGLRPEARSWFQLALGEDPLDDEARSGLLEAEALPPLGEGSSPG
ncbi:tetratricopeptide repeat protein [Tautonia sociabilis]|uniref:Tetratricopeptide repeat protein n=1 Tax=Tautonia sociabilis TaxID=2080755 RepID=A0A432MS19_9BACT|nr:tetratricopeptide repeat protein [Tautonia sociabilis]RUL89668.1 tetratricopeptide repeat protein [Tautonia sociabilis]